MMNHSARFVAVAAAVVALICGTPLWAQSLDEDFSTVTGAGGGTILDGSGTITDAGPWDTGIEGENAFAGTVGNAGAVFSAEGTTNGGVGGSGGGIIDVSDVNFNLLDQNFSAVSGTGGGVFLEGDGITPNTFNFTLSWDDGIDCDIAFAGTSDGAILNGSVSAQGVLTGGVGGSGGGEIVVDDVNLGGSGSWYAGLQFDIGPFPGGAAFLNSNFDDGPTGGGIQDWETYGNVFTETEAGSLSGAQAAKMYGTFSGDSGMFQRLTAVPGQTWELDVFSFHQTGDSLVGTSNFVVMKIEFLNAAEDVILEDEVMILDGSSPLDVWIDNAPLQLTAPPLTVEVRPVFEFVQPALEDGACFLDDARFRVVSGTPSVDLTQFALTADVKGGGGGAPCPSDLNGDGITNAADLAQLLGAWGPNPGNPADLNGDDIVNAADLAQLLGAWGPCPAAAGGLLGDYQLRIEDMDGNRLRFSATASETFQPVGNLLSMATEADADDIPAPGAFNRNSSMYSVVVAFDNDATNPWGTGGTLRADNLVLTNDDGEGSDWFAGLFWPDLLNEGGDLSNLELTADIKGDVVGGAYELRLEGFRITEAGLNDNFEGATGMGGGLFVDPTNCPSSPCFGFDSDWDTGIVGEGAFGGIVGDATVFTGISAQGLLAGGDPGKAGEIRVEDIGAGPGGGWYAGLNWSGQGLASTDLSQVTLSANVRGLAASGGTLGTYELRIEDQQGDRLFFPMTASGGWQDVGGPLSTATEGPAVGGGGDGNFDLDSPSYSVAVAFIDEFGSWGFGGVLQVDNLFLTPVDVKTEIGRVTFPGTANGAFQSVGGLPADGESSFTGFNLSLDGVTGTGAIIYGQGDPIGQDDWDDGIEGESTFFGTFGPVTFNGSATAQGCTNCGVGGSGSGQIIVDNVVPGAGGGWFAGLFWNDVPADLGGDLTQVELTADVKGEALGGTLGTYFIRVEDEDLTVLSFTQTADGDFQEIGGPLSDATLEQIESGDGVFNFNQTTYTVTVGFVGDNGGNWGAGGSLTVDNLFLTGISLESVDTFTVTVSFEEPLATWGQDGQITVDNLNLSGGNP